MLKIMKDTLKIQIWSDVMCPYCYIGKRRIEEALALFENRDAVEIEWKSFQLDASFIASPEDNTIDHLAEKYRKDREWAKEMVDNMTQNAKNSGLDFDFDKAILANTFNAHRLLHFAKTQGLGGVLKELLFKAYLTDGKNVDDLDTLCDLAQEVGLDKVKANEILHSNAYADEVKQDILTAQQIGVQGVPFFVFDDKYAISGAQHVETFVKTLDKVWAEGDFTPKMIMLNSDDADSCGIEGCN